MCIFKCNNLNINFVVTEITWFGQKKTILNNFKSKQHLLDCAYASMSIPFISIIKFPYIFLSFDNKYYLDGGLCGLPLCDTDDKQLIIHNHLYNYPVYKKLFNVDIIGNY